MYLVLTLVLSIFAIAPLFYPGYFQTHNGFVALWNVVDLRLNRGFWGWLPHIALQFDPLRGDGLLVYYLAALLPVAPEVAVKIVAGASWLLGGAGMFLWLKSWLGRPGATIAALVYVYLPYQIAAVYVRGAWGEVLFLGILPWALLSATFLVAMPRLWLMPVAAFFWLALGLSRLGLSLWAFLFCVGLLLAGHFRQSLRPILSALLGTTAALAVYRGLTPLAAASPVDFSRHFLYPFQLLSAYWGFGASRPGWNDGFSLQLGLAAAGLALLTLVLWQQRGPSANPRVSRADRRLLIFSVAAGVLLLLQFSLLAAVWRLPLLPGVSLAATLTYPWQLLGLAGLCLSVLAGASLWLDARLAQLPLFGAVAVLVLLGSYAYLDPRFVQTGQYPARGPQAQWDQARLVLLDHRFEVVTAGQTAGLSLGNTSIPVAVSGPLQPEQELLLRVTWQPLHTFEENWKVFVHLVDARGNVLAQFDGYPREGDYPTSEWIPGELIPDTYSLRLPPDAPPGPYRVYLGLYNEATLARLPVAADSEGRVILDVR